MKKDSSVILGIFVLAIAVFVVGALVYNNSKSSSSASTEIVRAPSDKLVRDHSPSLGPTLARVVMVEFLDPECESCRSMHPIIKNILKDYEGRVRYVIRYMPFHNNSALAATWLEAAREQNKYWEALDALFERQPDWGSHHEPRPDLIPEIVAGAGVDRAQAEAALQNPEFERRIRQDADDGEALGVRATPTIFVNGRMLERLGDSGLRSLIDEELE